jgi:ABC transporter substrate binding protein (PQQ-dependent alcohol dehydrogenase system)
MRHDGPSTKHPQAYSHAFLYRLGSACLVVCLCLLAFASVQAAAKKGVTKPTPAPAATPAPDTLKMAFLHLAPRPNLTQPPFFIAEDRSGGIQGARLGTQDNNTTGQFTHQHFELLEAEIPNDVAPAEKARQMLAQGFRHLIVNLPADVIKAIAALPEAQNALIYNVGSSDDDLRGAACSPNLLHLLPSRAMRADALAQFLSKKRWQKLLLAVGPEAADQAYAAAVRRAAARFGLKIAAERPWQHTFDERRTPESEIPVFTQGFEYDILVVADESGAFGDLLSYRTWLPRPVAGTQGLVPVGWHYTHEQWGAIQLQNRFKDLTGVWMSEVDYAAWLAVRAIGEAATRTKTLQFEPIRGFLRGPELSLAGFKGVPLSFRPWDGQLRQPVLLAAAHSLIAVSPIEGFLHPKTELDTLGYDQPESQCHLAP